MYENNENQMKWITNNTNHKWNMLYPTYLRAKGKRKIEIRQRLFNLLQENAFINKFNLLSDLSTLIEQK